VQRLGASTIFPMMPLFPAGSVNVSYTPVDRATKVYYLGRAPGDLLKKVPDGGHERWRSLR